MKKQGMMIGILILCLAILGGGFWLLQKDQGAEPAAADSGGTSDEKTAQESVSSAAEDPAAILAGTESDIAEISVQNEAGGFRALPSGDGWQIEGLEEIPVDERKIHSLIQAVTSLNSVRDIPDGSGRPEEFGVTEEKRSARVQITQTGGEEILLLLGDEAPGTDPACRYVALDDRVATVYRTKADIFLSGTQDFVDRNISPAYNTQVESFQITEVEISGRRFETPLRVQIADSSELAGVMLNTYELTSPVSYPADTSAMEQWLPSFFNLTGEGIKTLLPTEEDLRSCGLAEPWAEVSLHYVDGSGKEQDAAFAVSEPDASGMACARKILAPAEGEKQAVPVIYQVFLADIPWVSMQMQDIISRQILSPSVLNLSSLTFDLSGEEPIEIRLEQDPENSVTRAFIDGKELEDTSFRNFYYMLISQSVDEVLFEESVSPDIPETPETKITFRYLPGKGEKGKEEDEISYYPESDRMLYVTKNEGECAYHMASSRLTVVQEALKKLASGEKVEARY